MSKDFSAKSQTSSDPHADSHSSAGKPLDPRVASRKLSDDDVLKLRAEKVELNRHSRRQTGMKKCCKGKSDNLLECETPEGRCPDFDICKE
ncbi:MAG: hypothetical protein HQM09_16430 [Candidatus Riflebacteria bacterium]|nr:hypothetical protein [Candidatus Riflebacteria bacterium]